MIRRIYRKLSRDGIVITLQQVCRLAFPPQLKHYRYCKPFFQSKVGLEIGGPSGVFGLRGIVPAYRVAARIDNCNFGSHTIWEGVVSEGDTFRFNKRKAPGRQYVVEGSDLRFIETATYDFVLSSHCIEHLANPLQALSEWVRVIKEDGALVLVAPHKEVTFDRRRPVTTLDHLIQDFNKKTDERDMTHLEEVLKLHDLSQDPCAGDVKAFRERSERNFENRCMHHHVFDTRLAVEVVHHMGLQILAVEIIFPFHIVIVAQKLRQGQTVNNERFRGIDSAPCWQSPYLSDQQARREKA